jgi:hypothetical protein
MVLVVLRISNVCVTACDSRLFHAQSEFIGSLKSFYSWIVPKFLFLSRLFDISFLVAIFLVTNLAEDLFSGICLKFDCCRVSSSWEWLYRGVHHVRCFTGLKAEADSSSETCCFVKN